VKGALLWRGASSVLLASALVFTASAQTPSAAGDNPPPYKSLRFDENYLYLQDPARRGDVWDPLKYIPLASDPHTYLSLGGELRERGEYFSAPLFGLRGGGADAYLLHRLLLSGDLHITDDFRAFVQLGNHLEAEKDKPLSQADVDRFDLQQAFIDLHLPFAPDAGIDPTVRAGRQEMAFGSQRLVSVRESPNIRRSFDGFRVFDTIGGARVDAFVTRPVLLKQGFFDDEPNHSQAFWGLYGTVPLPFGPGDGIDLYYLGLDNETARFGTVSGAEHRQTLGVRLFGAHHGWDWDYEAVGQFGNLAGEDIRAWTVATNTGFTLEDLPWKPRLGMKANIASGDHNPADHTLGTFNPLFPKLNYFNEASIFSPGNFFDFNPEITVKPRPDVTVAIGWDFLWRESTRDAVYVNPFTPLAGTAGVGGKRIGDQVSLEVIWQADRHIQVFGSYVHFNAASAITAIRGRDVDFGMLSVAYKF
jgi:Alginate export